jgi:hypothetical protein
MAWKKALPFLSGGLAGDRTNRVGSDLDRDLGVRLEVVIPVWVGGRAAVGGDDDITISVGEVPQ